MSDAPQINTESDYHAAISELAQLWGAKSGTPESDRLDVLATLIDAYEALHAPMDVAIIDGAEST